MTNPLCLFQYGGYSLIYLFIYFFFNYKLILIIIALLTLCEIWTVLLLISDYKSFLLSRLYEV